MPKKILGLLFAGALIAISLVGYGKEAPTTITVFCGAATKPAMEEAAETFGAKTGIQVYLNFGGSGAVLSQMKLSRSGDLFIPGSPDYMEKAKREALVFPETEKIVAYLIPAVLVQHGNPKNIRVLSDLAGPGIEVGIGNPEAVCVGLYAIEILKYNGLLKEVGKNIVTYAESCSKTASLVALKSVDAVLGWRVFSKWHPDSIDVVCLEPDQIPRLAYVPGAVSTFTKDRRSAQAFLEFLVSPEGQKIFAEWGYITTETQAREFAPTAKIGGEYILPKTYKP